MADYLRSLPLHWSQKEIKATDKYVDFEYKLNINHELVLEILGKGKSVEVLEPSSLKKQIKIELSSLNHTYNYEQRNC